jgi:hypothetical protein
MATKQQLIDTFYQQLKKTHPGHSPHRLLVEQNMARAWNQILHDAFRKDLSFLDFYAKPYLSQSVSQDGTTNQYYVTLPVAIVQLPDKAEGVREVQSGDQNFNTPLNTGVLFVPESDMGMRYKTTLDVGLSESGVIGYAVRYDRIYFDESMDATQAAKGVHLKLVVPFDVYDSTEVVPVPSGKDSDLYAFTTQFMMGTIPQNA